MIDTRRLAAIRYARRWAVVRRLADAVLRRRKSADLFIYLK